MNIFKRSWIIPVLFKHMTKIFGENYLSLLRYNADQFSFLETKSLQTALTGDHLLVGWRLMWGRLPQCLSRFLVVSSVLKEMCLPFSDSCRPPRGLRANRGVKRHRCSYPSTIFLQGSRIRSQTWPCKPRSWVSPATLTRHPELPSHTMSGRLPSVELGSGPPGWDFTDLFTNAFCLLTSLSSREEEGNRWQGPLSAQSLSCLSSGRLCI